MNKSTKRLRDELARKYAADNDAYHCVDGVNPESVFSDGYNEGYAQAIKDAGVLVGALLTRECDYREINNMAGYLQQRQHSPSCSKCKALKQWVEIMKV